MLVNIRQATAPTVALSHLHYSTSTKTACHCECF